MSGVRTPIAAFGLVLIAGLATACQPAAPSATSPSATSTVACIDPAVRDAIELVAQGDLDTDPPLDAVADSLEAIELEELEAVVRDSLVNAIRADPIQTLPVIFAAQDFLFNVNLPLWAEGQQRAARSLRSAHGGPAPGAGRSPNQAILSSIST